jgi:pimeloyl-ACP methyl ester carboxylesterase
VLDHSTTFTPAPVDTDHYDEFALVEQNAAEMGVAWPAAHMPRREHFTLPSGQGVSTIRWGGAPPEYVFLHGGGQNAHTWDSVIVALGVPALAVDLPGHGHSDRRADTNYSPWQNALAVAEVLEQIGSGVRCVVGMSLGAITNVRLAARWPQLVHRAVFIDATPAVNKAGRVMTPEQRGSVALIAGPPTYDSFEQVFETTLAMSPKRTREGIFRGVRHNTVRLADGRWAWRYDLFRRSEDAMQWSDFTSLWDDVSALAVPTMLVTGGDSVYVLEEDIDEFRRCVPSVRVETVAGAGHAVQSDQPAALVALLRHFSRT